MSSVVAVGAGTAAEDGTGTTIAKAEVPDPADKPEFHDAHCLSFFSSFLGLFLWRCDTTLHYISNHQYIKV
jgi:hypothetical protein